MPQDRGYFADIGYAMLTADHWAVVDEYTAWLETQICAAITQAVENMAPSKLRWGQGVAGELLIAPPLVTSFTTMSRDLYAGAQVSQRTEGAAEMGWARDLVH